LALTLPFSGAKGDSTLQSKANPVSESTGRTIIFADLAQRHNRLWLVINSSRFVPWSARPVEEYLTRHYFPVSEVQTTDTARAVLFDLTSAPVATFPAWPEQRVDAIFGGSAQLTGYDIPGGTTRQPEDVVPVSLLCASPIPRDYAVSVFALADGALIAQHDLFPANYFDLMQAWRTGSSTAIITACLPAALAPGDYALATSHWWETPDERLTAADRWGSPLAMRP
jgi:hypothetical protein